MKDIFGVKHPLLFLPPTLLTTPVYDILLVHTTALRASAEFIAVIVPEFGLIILVTP